jgi:hypothetical protein
VGVAGEDRVDLGARLVHDAGERATLRRSRSRARRTVGCAGAGALVELGDDDVGFTVGRVAVAELGGNSVDRVDRVAERETDDAGG